MTLGIGVMLDYLSGNATTVNALKGAIGKTISSVTLDKDTNQLRIAFSDKTAISVWDSGQSCCESRYMRSDDDLTYYTGAQLFGMEIREAPSIPSGGEKHEVQFLAVKTSKGEFVLSSHNERNGYYGGFSIQIVNEEN
jgi:hypothetical protein